MIFSWRYSFVSSLTYTNFVSDFLDTLGRYLNTYGRTVLIYDGAISKVVAISDCKFLELVLSSIKFIDKSLNYTYFQNWLGTGLLTSTGKTVFKYSVNRLLILSVLDENPFHNIN